MSEFNQAVQKSKANAFSLQKQKVPVLRFPEFDGELIQKKLGEICEIRTGPFGSLLHEKDYVKNGTPIITVEHLSDFGLNHVNMPRVSETDKHRLKSYTLQENDIVFSRVGSVDRNSIIKKEEDGWLFSGRLLRIRANSKIINPKYLSYSFQFEYTKHRIRSVAVGQTMPSLNTQILRKFTIVFVNCYKEQQKIASFLNAVDQRLQLLQSKKEKLDDYKKGVMQQIFSQEIRFKIEDKNGKLVEAPDWEEKRLGEICEKKSSNISANTLEESNGEYKIYGATGFLQYVDFYREEESYISIVKDGAGVGRILLCEEKSSVLGTLDIIKPKGDNCLTFLFALISRIEFRKYITGSTIPHIYFKDYSKEKVEIPCAAEQQKIASFLSAIDQQIAIVEKQLNQSKQFKQGLLQKMFV